MPASPLTVDEIVEFLRRSSLPTVLCEGSFDSWLIRRLEDLIAIGTVDVVPCGGRRTLLDVYERRGEITNVPVAFLADKDLWYFSGVPAQYREIVLTSGYCIENDLYHFSTVEDLLSKHEKAEFDQSMDCVVRWFGCEVDKFTKGQPFVLDVHVSEMLTDDGRNIRKSFATKRGFVEPDPRTYKSLKRKYSLAVRGKQLFQLLVRYLSSKERKIKHRQDSIKEYCLPKNKGVKKLIVQLSNQLST